MLDEQEYQEFVNYLKAELATSDHQELNDFELLIDFYRDYPPDGFDDPDSEFFKEEIERRARKELEDLKERLKKNEGAWLIVDNGKFKAGKSEERLDNKSELERKLSQDEANLLNKPFDELENGEREALLTLFDQKVSRLGTNDEKYRVIKTLCDSYKYSKEEGGVYLKALKNAGNIADDLALGEGFKYYETSAKIYRENYDHDASAEQFKLAIKSAKKTQKSSTVLLTLTRSMRIQYELAGDEDNASIAFLSEKKLERKVNGKKQRGLLHCLSDYGQNPGKVVLWAMGLIVICTLLYALLGIVPSGSNAETQSLFEGCLPWYVILWDSLYFSIVTFTTLGYGDFSPGTGVSRLVANLESLLGLFLTSLFLVALVRKYGR